MVPGLSTRILGDSWRFDRERLNSDRRIGKEQLTAQYITTLVPIASPRSRIIQGRGGVGGCFFVG